MDHFKAFIEFAVQHCFCFMFWFFGPKACGILSFPTKNQTHTPLHWKMKS